MEKLRLDIGSYSNSDSKHQILVMTHKQESADTADSNSAKTLDQQLKQNNQVAKKSNYRLFMEQWQENKSYPLPSCFQLLNIKDRSGQQINNEYQWFNFSILSYSCPQLCQIASKLISENGFNSICDVSLIRNVVNQICKRYNIVSYHNFSHGFSVMHMFYQLTKIDPKFKNLLTNEEIGYCLVAGLGHDINHPGTNNGFQVKLNSQFAKEAQNQAVLQKMHVRILFSTLKDNNLDIFEKSSNATKMKQLMTRAILSTDVAKHWKNLEKLKFLTSNIKQSVNIEQNKYFIMEQAFHACDIGNPCLEYQEYVNWAALLSYEFNTQTLLQKQNNVQVTDMLKYKSKKGFYEGQIGFIKNLVFPLWKQLSSTWNGFSFLVENIQINLKLLQIRANEDNTS